MDFPKKGEIWFVSICTSEKRRDNTPGSVRGELSFNYGINIVTLPKGNRK